MQTTTTDGKTFTLRRETEADQQLLDQLEHACWACAVDVQRAPRQGGGFITEAVVIEVDRQGEHGLVAESGRQALSALGQLVSLGLREAAHHGHVGTTPSHPKASKHSGVHSESRNVPAGPAGHQGLFDAQGRKSGVGAATSAGQVHTATGIAAPTLWVVIRKSVYPALALLRLRLGLLGLKAKIGVLSLQQRHTLTQQSQVLTEHRRRCVLVEQRLHFFEQRLKHFISLGFQKNHRSAGGAA